MGNNKSRGRTVAITGAGGGIGAALVRSFLANDDTVVGVDLSSAALDTLQDDLDNPVGLHTTKIDVTNPDQVDAMANLISKVGGLDILVNCAGFFPFDTFEETTLERWRSVIDINLTGYYLVTHTMLPQMRGRSWGRIINFGSASIFRGVAGQAHYVAAKAGVLGLTRSLAREVGNDGITVNLITPGLTLTSPVIENFDPHLIEAQRQSRAIARDQTPEDLVGPVRFLASPDADFITGQTLNVDGGMFMN